MTRTMTAKWVVCSSSQFVIMHEWQRALSVNCWLKFLPNQNEWKFAAWLCEQTILFQNAEITRCSAAVFWSVHAGLKLLLHSTLATQHVYSPISSSAWELGCIVIGWVEYKHLNVFALLTNSFFSHFGTNRARMKPTCMKEVWNQTWREGRTSIYQNCGGRQACGVCVKMKHSYLSITLHVSSVPLSTQMGRCYAASFLCTGIMLWGKWTLTHLVMKIFHLWINVKG